MTQIFCNECVWVGGKGTYGDPDSWNLKCNCPEHESYNVTWYEKSVIHPLCSVVNGRNNCQSFKQRKER